MAAHQNGSEANHSQSLKHGLKSRHLTMISIAGVIGGSLFVGSGSIIYNTGPVVFLTYALGGLLVWFIMRMLGEMAVLNPDSGSFQLMLTVRLVVGQGFQWLVVLVYSGHAHGVGSLCGRKNSKQLVPVYTNLGLYGRGDWCAGCR